MSKHGLKTAAALLAGGVAALDAARRFSRRVPQENTVVIFETIGRVPGRKKDKVFIGYPIHATESVIEDASTKQQTKEIRKGVREADKWLRSSSREEDGRRRQNKTLGGNRQAVCEFVVVKRTRNAKGKAIGVTKRCFTMDASTETTDVREDVRITEPAPLPPIPDSLPDFGPSPAFASLGRFYR
jgi:hypothetical protein